MTANDYPKVSITCKIHTYWCTFMYLSCTFLIAATAYRIAKSYDKSKECFLKAIDAYKNNKSWFHAAKAYEQVSLN